MQTAIIQRLNEIAKQQGFQVLYACESGSRAWGFASPDSDYDVRFIFVWPQANYLQLDEPAADFHLMEKYGDELLDFSGWELRKFLRHIRRANLSVYEWLQSPFCYVETSDFREAVWALAQSSFSVRACIHHYLGIAHNSINTGVKDGKISIKKYFYILRPLLAARWGAARQAPPPITFADLLVQLDEKTALLHAIKALWEQKMQALEGDVIPLDPVIQEFITDEMARLKQFADNTPKDQGGDFNDFDIFFKKQLK